MSEFEEFFGPAVFVYSRAQALADGILFDVTEGARSIGFRVPVAMSAGVLRWIAEYGDSSERLGLVIITAYLAARANPKTDRVCFDAALTNPGGRDVRELLMVCGPEDNRRPAITICFPEED